MNHKLDNRQYIEIDRQLYKVQFKIGSNLEFNKKIIKQELQQLQIPVEEQIHLKIYKYEKIHNNRPIFIPKLFYEDDQPVFNWNVVNFISRTFYKNTIGFIYKGYFVYKVYDNDYDMKYISIEMNEDEKQRLNEKINQ